MADTPSQGHTAIASWRSRRQTIWACIPPSSQDMSCMYLDRSRRRRCAPQGATPYYHIWSQFALLLSAPIWIHLTPSAISRKTTTLPQECNLLLGGSRKFVEHD
ncbi:hypothetical protein P170DRAFT_289282 [Aspergillus steynii IBT 23096]|uniref:Uncharacterized protein n=1 Tax=Aspergillus steynii IBT 23096 TaxID=1392250 RepID=A0A2I2FVL2_9EURO|nr:uncharacterized protein P170DRAFT_289282 [Aspergillus steynii IBT 23096]PLB44606.1 hypothetical protein P170DRAFT_289282 [Aspergillus steynii IBT 23096]